MSECPCCSQLTYDQCCGPYLAHEAIPATPEALMRSRYTAFTRADIGYIKGTMRGRVLKQFDEKHVTQWAQTATWQGLEILDAPEVEGQKGYVSFVAKYLDGHEPQSLYERSEFKKEGNRWYYVQEHPYQQEKPTPAESKKIARNDPCPCLSGKKYKKCCFLLSNS